MKNHGYLIKRIFFSLGGPCFSSKIYDGCVPILAVLNGRPQVEVLIIIVSGKYKGLMSKDNPMPDRFSCKESTPISIHTTTFWIDLK